MAVVSSQNNGLNLQIGATKSAKKTNPTRKLIAIPQEHVQYHEKKQNKNIEAERN